ncbi:hypothetical protein JTE90_003971 [Oedothorax gibbosus]|uniref:Uncharacterized protein n=1 Tax=Oedothorax gibbosus TaxID=931172 RepID=A0AAV6UW51_9ARAC|nr:hypothetical protein JTE90_003971 [Oedothorax gibbosus]
MPLDTSPDQTKTKGVHVLPLSAKRKLTISRTISLNTRILQKKRRIAEGLKVCFTWGRPQSAKNSIFLSRAFQAPIQLFIHRKLQFPGNQTVPNPFSRSHADSSPVLFVQFGLRNGGVFLSVYLGYFG